LLAVQWFLMTTLADLHQAVQTTLANRRLGQPVFVRYLLHTREPADTLLLRLAQFTAVVRDWLAQPLDRLYALGSPESGHVSLTLQFRHGATALVTLAHAASGEEGADLLILGNHGALYHDAGSTVLWDVRPVDPTLLAAIERALRSGGPEPVPSGSTP
jgi:hypothetical protein